MTFVLREVSFSLEVLRLKQVSGINDCASPTYSASKVFFFFTNYINIKMRTLLCDTFLTRITNGVKKKKNSYNEEGKINFNSDLEKKIKSQIIILFI